MGSDYVKLGKSRAVVWSATTACLTLYRRTQSHLGRNGIRQYYRLGLVGFVFIARVDLGRSGEEVALHALEPGGPKERRWAPRMEES